LKFAADLILTVMGATVLVLIMGVESIVNLSQLRDIFVDDWQRALSLKVGVNLFSLLFVGCAIAYVDLYVAKQFAATVTIDPEVFTWKLPVRVAFTVLMATFYIWFAVSTAPTDNNVGGGLMAELMRKMATPIWALLVWGMACAVLDEIFEFGAIGRAAREEARGWH
jgi:hypothetical protein